MSMPPWARLVGSLAILVIAACIVIGVGYVVWGIVRHRRGDPGSVGVNRTGVLLCTAGVVGLVVLRGLYGM